MDTDEKDKSVTNANTHQVAVQGGKLPVWVQAGDSPAVVFLHYWGGSHRTFDPVIARLAPERAVVSYDYRGWGAACRGRRDGGGAVACYDSRANLIDQFIASLAPVQG